MAGLGVVAAVGGAGLDDGAGQLAGGRRVEGDVEEARPGDVDGLDPGDLAEAGRRGVVATSRGGMPAPLASWRAMLVDQSPWSRFLGRSTRTSAGTSTARSPAATASVRAVRIAAESCSGVTRASLGRGRVRPARRP